MRSVIFAIDVAEKLSTDQEQAIRGFVNNCVDTVNKDGAAQMLGKYCWQIPLDNGLHVFGFLITQAAERRVPYRVLFLPDGLEWIENS